MSLINKIRIIHEHFWSISQYIQAYPKSSNTFYYRLFNTLSLIHFLFTTIEGCIRLWTIEDVLNHSSKYKETS